MNKEEFLKAIMELPKVETISPISVINSINVDDLMSAVDRLNKVPNYNDLLKENKKLHEELEWTIGIVEHNRIIGKKNKEIHQLREQLLAAQTNEETFRLEMEDITRALGLDEDTLFDDAKAYARSLKDNWNKLKEYIKETKLKEFEKSYGKRYGKTFTQAEIIICNMILDKMQELKGSDSNEYRNKFYEF